MAKVSSLVPVYAPDWKFHVAWRFSPCFFMNQSEEFYNDRHIILFLGMYVDDISEGTAEKTGTPIIVKEKVGTALVDAKNVLGPVSVYLILTVIIS